MPKKHVCIRCRKKDNGPLAVREDLFDTVEDASRRFARSKRPAKKIKERVGAIIRDMKRASNELCEAEPDSEGSVRTFVAMCGSLFVKELGFSKRCAGCISTNAFAGFVPTPPDFD